MRDMMLLPGDGAKINYLAQRVGSCNIKIAELEGKLTAIKTMIDDLLPNATQADFLALVSEIKKIIDQFQVLPVNAQKDFNVAGKTADQTATV